jgi:ABC-type Fe3+-siderophore transport system permease subunit
VIGLSTFGGATAGLAAFAGGLAAAAIGCVAARHQGRTDVVSAIALPFFARGLNALVLGEGEARHLGFHPERLRIVPDDCQEDGRDLHR